MIGNLLFENLIISILLKFCVALTPHYFRSTIRTILPSWLIRRPSLPHINQRLGQITTQAGITTKMRLKWKMRSSQRKSPAPSNGSMLSQDMASSTEMTLKRTSLSIRWPSWKITPIRQFDLSAMERYVFTFFSVKTTKNTFLPIHHF